jgi:hypothetical protein
VLTVLLGEALRVGDKERVMVGEGLRGKEYDLVKLKERDNEGVAEWECVGDLEGETLRDELGPLRLRDTDSERVCVRVRDLERSSVPVNVQDLDPVRLDCCDGVTLRDNSSVEVGPVRLGLCVTEPDAERAPSDMDVVADRVPSADIDGFVVVMVRDRVNVFVALRASE